MALCSISGISGALEDLGTRGVCAHFQHRDCIGRKEHIRGPRREHKREAEMDLDSLWAAGLQTDVDAAWGLIANKARRLCEEADFAHVVATRACQYARTTDTAHPVHMETDSLESERVYDSVDYGHDANELWQELDHEGRLPSSWVPASCIPVPNPHDDVDASALLSKFRPARMSVDDLKKLLQARADPNISLCGDISPLMKVMTFAGADKVGPMRSLLLGAGARETDEDRERWIIRRRADACEDAWMRNFHRDPR